MLQSTVAASGIDIKVNAKKYYLLCAQNSEKHISTNSLKTA